MLACLIVRHVLYISRKPVHVAISEPWIFWNAYAALHSELGEQEIGGTLKIAAPLAFGVTHLVTVVDEFARHYPKLKLDVNLSDSFINLVESGVDMAIRIGALENSSLKARKISSCKALLVASPDYLKKMGTPETPEDLARHVLLQYETARGPVVKLIDRDGRVTSHSLSVRLIANNGDFLNELAIKGQGLVISPTFICREAVNQGQLIPVLTDYEVPMGDIYAIYPTTRHISKSLRLFIDYLVECFGNNPEWEGCQL